MILWYLSVKRNLKKITWSVTESNQLVSASARWIILRISEVDPNAMRVLIRAKWSVEVKNIENEGEDY